LSEGHNRGLPKANEHILKLSLVKNGLLQEVRERQLLQRLAEMLEREPSGPNIDYVLAVCGNVIDDDIGVEEKEYIYHIYCKHIHDRRNQSSPSARVYFYYHLIVEGYECVGDDVK
jgi:hypothetical protein